MLTKLHFSGVFLIIILLCCAIAMFFSKSPIQMLLMFVVVIAIGGYLPFFVRENHKQRNKKFESFQFKVLHQAVEQFCEYAIFSLEGELIKTSHPHLYQNMNDFMQKLDWRFANCNQWPQFKRWIEERHMGDMLLKVPQANFEKDRLLLGRVLPHDQQHYEIQALFIGFEDVSIQFEEHENIHLELKNLQNFLDHLPFAMFYVDKKNQIHAFNKTFASWVKQSDSEIGNQPIKQFIDGFNDNQTVQIVSIKPFRYPPFKAIYFPPAINSKTGAALLCRIDNIALAESTASASEETFLKAPIPGIIINQDLKIISFNQACQQLMETATPQKTIIIDGDFCEFINQNSQEQLKETLQNNTLVPLELSLKDSKVHCIAYISQIASNEYLLQLMDISQQKHLEQQFIQSQKMQAVGQLAGGIAHDFNNLLTAMIGFCDLLLQRYMPNDPAYLDVSQIKQNANRAANLVRQLLAFSRQQTLQPRIVNITDALSDLSSLLRRLIGARIELDVIHGRDIWPVKVDVSQFEQVVINLAVNSRDAMAEGGKLTIKTSNVSNTKPTPVGNEFMPEGDFVTIDVTDTGCGIPNENLEHIFEPFFSTKEVGAGTGLGLATVYGIVKQTGGFIFVESKINKGTNFKICLPRHAGVMEIYVPSAEIPRGDLSGSGTILLVEDEDAVRIFSARALRDKGYKVIEASNGEDALEIVTKGAEFDLLVTDVVMPHMDGPSLNKKVRAMVPDLKTIFISGYAEDAFRKNLGDDTNIHFLPKPFTLKDLAAKVKDVIIN
jgi:two-component system cell cycle sensor histidine kinase/response regulator CckA